MEKKENKSETYYQKHKEKILKREKEKRKRLSNKVTINDVQFWNTYESYVKKREKGIIKKNDD